ncbi:N-acetyltransferase [Pasteurellaceae bacterium HPA106]|uniref:GNAT family N-acetyltransferase n=1 Tax=Spirabiliibacterium pneumoniae TaxID=221400 RepID=UPI001AACA99A|nr:GNAT family N-acetyltransferase [Spirabiliibacterium pneumoniae]MBE2896210.1 N-acetyltransferase [Spirabiliibacterium pneumoniae]
MDIQQEHDESGGKFFIAQAGKLIAELTYQKINEHSVNANHTFVSPQLRGQGVADQLYQAFKEYVAQQGYHAEASCSYVAAKLAREKA